jgi:hypothetical protein
MRPMKAMKLMMAAIAYALIATSASNAIAAEQKLDPKAITIKLPDQIPWKRNEAAGNETAVLLGDPSKAGLYIQMFKWLPGHMSRPHWHPNDRYITVPRGPGGSARATNSTPTRQCRWRPAAMWSIPPRRSTTTAPKARRYGC